MGTKKTVEGNASYRLDADIDTITKAWSAAEARLRIAASIHGGTVTGEIDANTYTAGGVVLIRMTAPFTLDARIERA